VSMRVMVMSQQSARQAARRSASDAHTVLRKQPATGNAGSERWGLRC
jgi:hypothetical protein